MRYKGKITLWKDSQGFGFITPSLGGKQVFVHIKSFQNRRRRPMGNEIVTYEFNIDATGRAQAENVRFSGDRVSPDTSAKDGNVSIILTLSFLICLTASAFFGKLPAAIPAFYFGASIIAFFAYLFDKSAAINKQWRTQESTLHFFSLIGGWPGALVAQKILRHKSRKRSFQVAFRGTVIFNCSALGALAWLFSSSGSQMLKSILGAA